jgi:hypothetical protein
MSIKNIFKKLFLNYIGKMVRAGTGAGIFGMLEPEPLKHGPAPQHWIPDTGS